jgi:non-ribosomal peptide synthetase component F
MSGSLVDAKASLVSALEFSGAALEAFDRWVAKQPEKVAVTYGETGETFTYAAWGDLTDRIAASLAGAGVKPGDRVVVISTSPLVCTMWMFAGRREPSPTIRRAVGPSSSPSTSPVHFWSRTMSEIPSGASVAIGRA